MRPATGSTTAPALSGVRLRVVNAQQAHLPGPRAPTLGTRSSTVTNLSPGLGPPPAAAGCSFACPPACCSRCSCCCCSPSYSPLPVTALPPLPVGRVVISVQAARLAAGSLVSLLPPWLPPSAAASPSLPPAAGCTAASCAWWAGSCLSCCDRAPAQSGHLSRLKGWRNPGRAQAGQARGSRQGPVHHVSSTKLPILTSAVARAAACASLYCRLVQNAVPPTTATTPKTASRSQPVWRRVRAVLGLAIAMAPCKRPGQC